MNSALAIANIVVVVLLVAGAFLGWRRRQRRKLNNRRELASQHREIASMSHFEAEREAARESERAARIRRDKLAAQQVQPENDGPDGDSSV